MRQAKPIRIEGDVAYISLTQGFEAVIDVGDIALVSTINWHASVRACTVYASANTPKIGGVRTVIRLHRFLFNNPDGLEIDHIDGDGLNNRRSNLRIATVSQNRKNKRLIATNTSGLKGARQHRKGGKWIAQIMSDGKKYHIGMFDTKEAAHSAYMDAAKRLHGEFVRKD